MRPRTSAQVRIVVDANVFIDHVRAEDPECSAVIKRAKEFQHTFVVCEKLLNEYRGVLAGGMPQMYSIVDAMLLQIIPPERVEKHPNPKVTIDFGPEEDRPHLQLAIDQKVHCHITKEGGIHRVCGKMWHAGSVRLVRPSECVRCPGTP